MNYIIPIVLIIIIIIFDYFKINISETEFYDNKAESNDISDLYVITLGKEERMINIKDQQSKINRNIHIFDAINGLKLDLNSLKNENILSNNNNLSKNENHAKREIGCFLVNSDNLLEDVKKAIKTLQSKNIDFDFLFLGNTTNNYGTNISDNLYNVNPDQNLYGTYGYVINNKSIDKIIEKTNKIQYPIDVIIQNLSYNNTFNTYIVYPNLVKHQWSYKSSVNNKENVI